MLTNLIAELRHIARAKQSPRKPVTHATQSDQKQIDQLFKQARFEAFLEKILK